MIGDPHEDHPLWEQQVDLERGMQRQGAEEVAERTAKAVTRKRMARLDPVKAYIKEWLPVLADGIKEWIKDSKKRGGGPTPIALPYLEMIDPYVASLITLRQILNSVTIERLAVTPLAIDLGQTIEHELQVRKWEKEEPELFRRIANMLERDEATSDHRAKVNINRFNHHLKAGTFGFGWDLWPEEVHLRVGITLIELVLLNIGWFELVADPSAEKTSRWKRVPYILAPTAQLRASIGNALDRQELLSPALKPTIIPPKRWEGTRRGGYFTPYVMTPRLIRFKASQEDQKERAADEYDAIDMPQVYEAIHVLQEVPWRVNKRVLEVSRKAFTMNRHLGFIDKHGKRMGIGGLPLAGAAEEPYRSGGHEAHNARVRAAKEAGLEPPKPSKELGIVIRDWRRAAKKVNADNAHRVYAVETASRLMDLGDEFSRYDRFYFPHMLDFRGRMYPIPVLMQPQGSDLAKGILEFAEGKPIGETGGYWLAISVAGHWGNDKVSLDDRVAWVEEHLAEWQTIADDPLGAGLDVAIGGKHWHSGDHAWRLLAAIMDFVGALREGDTYVSHQPCAVDGTCNGIQHLSAMTRDAVAGSLVNLTPKDKPQDIYQAVADKLYQEVKRAARVKGETGSHARFWLQFATERGFNRSMTKRQTMVLPYGGTQEACFKYTRDWLRQERANRPDIKELEFLEEAHKIGWLARLLWKQLADTVAGGVTVMQWLQQCAKAVAEGDQPVFWITPAGMVVRHFYGKVEEKRIFLKLSGEETTLAVPYVTKELDVQSQLRGIPPNFTHSIDASCLVTTITKLVSKGITAFTAVHDAYGTHACDMWALYHLLREAFVETHKQDLLGLFRDGCRRVLVDQLVAKGMDELDAVRVAEGRLPAPLQMGSLDIEGVLKADYFFH